jgi:preprotein translocase subunit SecG
VDKIAAIAEGTEALLKKTSAIFCFIFAVLLLILLQFMQPMGKLTSILIGAASVLDKLLAEL